MNYLYTNIAKLNIRISHRYGYIARICENYLCADKDIEPEGGFDIDVSVTEEDTDREKKYIDLPEGMKPDPAYTESMAIFRKIAEALPDFGCFLMHGSSIAVDGKGYIFTAPSGTGKSTHVSLWRKAFGDRAEMVNDDKPFIRMAPEGIFVCGTPWNGKHRLGANICVPLKAICILGRGEDNEISPISSHDAFSTLLRQAYRPHDPDALKKTLGLLDLVAEKTELYELKCNMDPEAAIVSFSGMNR